MIWQPVLDKTRGFADVLIGGCRFRALPERALFWTDESILLAADLHIGKAASFRSESIPLPIGTTDDDLERLSTALDKSDARRLIVLGDLFHDSAAQDARFKSRLSSFQSRHAGIEFAVVPGNHHGSFKPGDPQELAAAAWCLVHGLTSVLIDERLDVMPAGARARRQFLDQMCRHLPEGLRRRTT